MAEPSSTPDPTPPSQGARVLPRGDSRKRLLDDVRRDRFKGRAKDLERGISAPILDVMSPLPLNENEVVTVGQGMGHDLTKKTFYQPTYCHYCSELLWGLRGQGYLCKVCNYVSHEKCVPFLKTPCRHLLADAIQVPVAHQWTKPMQFKKKICNVCRKKITREAVLCEVCKYYAHKNCKDNAFNDCKKCAIFSAGAALGDSAFHHWIEGNLPSSARCQVCTKNCSSTDCLTGFRCGWCGIEVHSKCLAEYQKKKKVCNFRDLWGMIVLPQAISHCSIISSGSEPGTPLSGDVAAEDCVEEEEDETDSGGDGKRPCIVIDGRGEKGFRKWRKTTVHPINLTKKITAQELLTISVRKCGISEDIADYYLAEMLDSQKALERELDPNEIPHDIQFGVHGLLRLYLRHRSHKSQEGEVVVRGRMKIGNGHLGTQVVVIDVTTTTTAAEIVSKALIKFGMESESSPNFCLVEVSQVMGVVESVLADSACPWKNVHELRRDSLTLSNRQRYHIRHRKEGEVSIFLKGVGKELLQDKEKYTDYIVKLFSGVSSFNTDHVEIGPSFPTLGGMILTFPTFELASKLCQAIKEHPDSPDIIIIPSIHTHIGSVTQEPLLVFINGKSGGNQGVELISAFRRHLNPHQIWDLSKGGPVPGLWAMKNLTQFRILIGGGDGTFGWILGALQEMKDYLSCKEPPSALLPLGTGNDLARALKWGGGYAGEKVMPVLLSLEEANVVCLDRWTVSFKEQNLPSKEKVGDAGPSSIVMNNYMGIGLDAAIALDFHLAREENPEKFSSRLHNKGFYLQLGLQKMVAKGEVSDLYRHITLTVDGNRIKLPEIAGLIILNIQSWGGGADPWGTNSDPMYKPAAYNDGLLEVVGLTGVMQMGQVQTGIRNAVRIAQGSELKIDLLSPLPVQVDGEAWGKPPSIITIDKLPNSAVMLERSEKAPNTSSTSLKNQITLLHTVSSSGIEFCESLSTSRRSVLPVGVSSPSTEIPPTLEESEEQD